MGGNRTGLGPHSVAEPLDSATTYSVTLMNCLIITALQNYSYLGADMERLSGLGM
jgi:hypothetical protein